MKINVRIILNKNHGMDTVHLSIDSGCWPPEDIVIQTKLGMSALVDAETRCVLYTGLLLEELWSKVVPLYMLTNHCILQPGNCYFSNGGLPPQ